MARKVRIATCSVRHDFRRSEIDQSLALIDQAGEERADIVCLPEYVAAVFREDGSMVAERVPGPTTRKFAALARKHSMYVIVPLVETTDGEKDLNTCVVLDRNGKLAGKYSKTHVCLPGHGEGEKFIAGDELPVFQADFGAFGISICMDIHYPELYTAMALKGAEIIFWPSGAYDYTGDLIESLVNARAIDNQVYFVCSHHIQLPYLTGKAYGRSRVVDPMGRIRCDTGHFPGVAVATVDLDETYPIWYTGAMLEEYPTMRETLFKTRRPELYGELVKPVRPSHYRRGVASKKRR